MTWIKICGTTNLADALMAVEAGADALGFVFAESMRRVTPEIVAEITPHLPSHIEKVGVFVSETPEQIRDIAKRCGLTAVQLNRNVTIPGLGDIGVIPVWHMSEIEEEQYRSKGAFSKFVDDSAKAILLDSGNPEKGGGTGKRFDWQRAQRFIKSTKLDRYFPFVVAGGLAPENVAEAIRIFQPFGVDVVTGVEREKGRKDPDKVRAFIAAARTAENSWSADVIERNRREAQAITSEKGDRDSR